MTKDEKLQVFLEVAGLLNRELHSLPVLYGSLGLAQLIPDKIHPSDIDILLESEIFDVEHYQLPQLMARIGFRLADSAEQEYVRGSFRIGIASDADLVEFAGIDPQQLIVESTSTCSYRVLTLKDYLLAYEASSRDGYRKDVREKDDRRKLELIRTVLQLA